MSSPNEPGIPAASTVRLFFGHQSVGMDLLTGLSTLAGEGRNIPRILETTRPWEDSSAALIAHARVGRNFEPRSKLTAFADLLATGVAGSVSVAMMKFCYVDIRDQSAAEEVFGHYVSAMDDLRRLYPDLLLAHVTVPLRVAPRGVRAALGKLLGRRDTQRECNRARAWFNEELRRATCEWREPLFDLAAIETNRPAGVHRTNGQSDDVPSLAAQLSSDGGHLNERGRRMVATAFCGFLSQLQELPCQRTR